MCIIYSVLMCVLAVTAVETDLNEKVCEIVTRYTHIYICLRYIHVLHLFCVCMSQLFQCVLRSFLWVVEWNWGVVILVIIALSWTFKEPVNLIQNCLMWVRVLWCSPWMKWYCRITSDGMSFIWQISLVFFSHLFNSIKSHYWFLGLCHQHILP